MTYPTATGNLKQCKCCFGLGFIFYLIMMKWCSAKLSAVILLHGTNFIQYPIIRVGKIHDHFRTYNAVMKAFFLFTAILLYGSVSADETGQKGGIFRHLNSENSLSQSVVTSIVQDKTGFMWFGTFNGINRYDGKRIKQYKMKNDTAEIRSYFIINMTVDSRGNLWVATNSGIGIYDRSADRFLDAQTVFSFPDEVNHLDQVEYITEDSKGYIWIASTTGLFRLDMKTKKAVRVIPQFEANVETFLDTKIRIIEQAQPGILYFASQNMLFEYIEKENKAIKRVTLYKKGKSDIEDRIQDFGIDSHGTVWIGSMLGNGYKYQPNTKKLTRLNIPPTSLFNDLLVESDTTILLSLDVAGVLRYNSNTDKYETLYDKNNQRKAIKSNKIRRLFIDRQWILWLGHFRDGLSYTGLTSSGFQQFNSIIVGGRQVNLSSVSSVLKDHTGTLWIATDGTGLYTIDRSGQTASYTNNPDNPNSLPNDAVLSLHEDKDGVVWIGTYRGGLTYYRRNTNDFVSFQANPSDKYSISGNDVRTIREDNFGRLWLSTHGTGFSIFDKKTLRFTNIFQPENSSVYLLNNWTYATIPDKRGNVWIACSKGMSVYDTATKKLSILPQGDQKTRAVSESFVYTAFSDSKGRLWVGTDKGLCLYNYQMQYFNQISGQNSMPGEIIYSIEEDIYGKLWLGTNVGLFRYDPEADRAIKFSAHDGLQADEFIVNSASRDSQGIMYFGGVNGFNSFHPDNIDINREPPAITFTDIELMGVPIGSRQLENKQLILRYNQNFLTFHFVALNFIAPEKNLYRFKLIGLDTDWQNAGNEGKAVYTHLPPGEYTFMAIGANNDGVWNLKGTQFKVTILAPWWAMWWFEILVVFSIVGITGGYYFMKIREVRMRNVLLELKVAARTADLRKANEDLEEINALIEAKNEELNCRNTEIKQQNQLLTEKQEEIEQQHYNLQIQKEEIQTVNEELTTINNQLADHEAQLIEANDQLKQLVNTKDKMLSIIAHDLKNPMNTLIGFSSIIMGRTQTYDPHKLEKFIGLINQAAVNSYRLLENLLTWARSQTGNIKMEIISQDILPIIKEDIQFLKETAEKKDIKIDLSVQITSDSNAFIDANTVSTIFRNLISNAIKFTTRTGNITIVVQNTLQSNEIIVSVIDNGVGMTSSQIEKLFKVQNNNSTPGTDRESGTGLGLVICKEFAEMNKGRIVVESIQGHGSIFQVFLPKA